MASSRQGWPRTMGGIPNALAEEGSGRSSSPFPPIAEYGFLSDCNTTALVSPSGAVEWLCLPRMDSASVFSAMLDRDAGTFQLGPSGVSVPVARRYIPGTLVLETSWWTGSGWLVALDALVIGPWHHQSQRSTKHRRAPTDYDAEHILLRTVRSVSGRSEVTMDCQPGFDFGRRAARWHYAGDGYQPAVARDSVSGLELRLTTDLNLGFEGEAKATARTVLEEGECRYVALSWSEVDPPQTYEESRDRMMWTIRHWQRWLERGAFPDHPWTPFLQRSALTLKGLTYAPTGAIAAAPTTSLPETPGGIRNWDYRYTWLRDATLALWALYTLRFGWEADEFLYFIADVIRKGEGDLQIMYGIDGRSELPEQILDHLTGYEDARPVRIGNAAVSQLQHDAWGAVVGSIYLHVGQSRRIDDTQWSIVKMLVEHTLGHWQEPDNGIWEVRGERRHFVSSKIYCWLVADRGSRLAEARGDTERAKRWRDAAAEIKNNILENGLDDRGVFTQYYGTKTLDASVLLIPLLGFLPPDDPRVRSTVLTIAEELTENGLVLRYRTDETDDALEGEEGTFVMCSFWLISALVAIGETGRARALCEKLLSLASPLLLYGEEIDPHTGRHLGNFPQAFTHLSLINAVMQLIQVDQGMQPHIETDSWAEPEAQLRMES